MMHLNLFDNSSEFVDGGVNKKCQHTTIGSFPLHSNI